MKQIIRKRLCIVILTAMLTTLLINYYIEIHNAQNEMYTSAQEMFWQVGQILDQNEKEAEKERENLKEQCFIRAKAIAYILQDRPQVTGDQQEMEKIARLLQVDEFHLFDTKGNLYAGSEPKYFGLNFNSGQQMQFFLPMLENYDLQMCQDITPNTAEGKLMQYAAVWREDRKGIIQVGLEPTTVLDSMKLTELSYIFSLVTSEKDSTVYAIDPESETILGSTDETLVGKQIQDIGLHPDQMSVTSRGVRAVLNQKDSYCVFGKSNSVILGMSTTSASLYREVNRSTLMVAAYLIGLSLLMITFISKDMDRYILEGISSIHNKLAKITRGNLDTRVEVDSTPEFRELSFQINKMVESLLDTTNKISKILEMVRVPIGVYEYNRDMKRVMATSRLAGILRLKDQEAEELLADHCLFEQKLDTLRSCPVEREERIYRLEGADLRYIRLESFERENSVLGMIADVTDDIMEKKQIERERDIDLLTGMYNRRAFYRHMEQLLREPEQLEHGMMLMADADNLKQVNDKYGHENGDRYLTAIAGLLKGCGWNNCIAARLSGDEFALFLYKCSSRNQLMEYEAGLRKTMETCTAELDNGERIQVRFSDGYAFYPEDGTDTACLLKHADESMYEAKRAYKAASVRKKDESRGSKEGNVS